MNKRYILKATNAEYYIGQDGILVTTEDDALKFVTKDKAIAYKTNCLTKRARVHNWDILSCEYDESVVDESNDNSFYRNLLKLRNTLVSNYVEKDLSLSTIKYLDSILKVLSTKEKVIEYLSKYDQVLSDLQHYIEFHTLSIDDCTTLIEFQQKVLKKRRICKDRLITIQRIESLGLGYWKKLVGSLCSLSSRTYTNKVLGNENKTL